MRRWWSWWFRGTSLAMLVLSWIAWTGWSPAGWPGVALASGPAGDASVAVPNGAFFAQAGDGAGRGFELRDYTEPGFGQAAFWSAFQRLGGSAALGYPASRPFTRGDGCIYQLTQAALLQKCPGADVRLANTFEILEAAGLDATLHDRRQIPLPITQDGSTGFADAVRIRLGWLTQPEIRARYFAAPSAELASSWTTDDAISLYGLPMSRPEDFGPFIAQRFQRVTFQLWTKDVPGMPPAGSVVPVLGGDLLKEMGLVDGPAAQPHAPGESLSFTAPFALAPWPRLPAARLAAPPSLVSAVPTMPAPTVAATATMVPTAAPTAAGGLATAATALRRQPLQYGFQADLMIPAARAKAIAWTKEAGFGWLKQQVIWSQYELSPGVYDPERLSWLDAMVNDVNAAGLKLFLSVTGAPRFYTAPGGQPALLPARLKSFLQFLAARYRGKVQAYQTWNEPNMAVEWAMGPLWPNGPRDFVQLQRSAYEGVKAGDSGALVVFPALTPTGVGECDTCDRSFAIDDRVYLDLVYQVNGGEIRGYFDVLGVHAYGYDNPPGDWVDLKTVPSTGYKGHPSFYFKRFTQLREVMLKYGDDKPVWFAEFGWSACTRPVPGYDYCRDVSEADQARYLVDAITMVKTSYPYVTNMFVWNLNFQMIVPEQDQMWGFGVIRADGSPRPAYTALARLPK